MSSRIKAVTLGRGTHVKVSFGCIGLLVRGSEGEADGLRVLVGRELLGAVEGRRETSLVGNMDGEGVPFD